MKNVSGHFLLERLSRTAFLLGTLCTTIVAIGQGATLTRVSSVRTLTPEQASERRPVVLRGVVTALSGWKSSFFLQDRTAGISVNRDADTPPLEQGQLVEVRGVTDAGGFAPSIAAREVRVIGKGNLPPARLMRADQLAGGGLDSQWIEIRGKVRSAAIEPVWGRSVLLLTIDIGGGTLITARVHDFAPEQANRLRFSTVTVRGVCGSIFNDKRQFAGVRLFVAGMQDVIVERSAQADPFNVALRSAGSLLRFGEESGMADAVRVRGVVTWSQPGVGVYLQDGQDGIFIRNVRAEALAVGTRLEAVGYPSAGRSSPQLEDALYRVVGLGKPPAPLEKSATEMIVVRNTFSYAPYDSVLVKTTGTLLQKVPGAEEDLLLLQDGPTIFTAKLPHAPGGLKKLVTGSLLSVTGVCRANDNEAHEAHSFEILLRTTEDVHVVRGPPWWTAAHAGWIVAVLAVSLLVMSVWVGVTRRQAMLRALAITDPLTGIYNLRGFNLLGQQQWQLAQRRQLPLVLFYIDLNDFKQINDTYGHKTGDNALRGVAGLLRDCFRSTDVVGRLGGDEFAVTAFDVPPLTQASLQKRIDSAVDQFNRGGALPCPISLSIGVLACEPSMGPIEDLLSRADALMYEQKRRRKKGPDTSRTR